MKHSNNRSREGEMPLFPLPQVADQRAPIQQGKLLRRIRKEQGILQAQAAEAIGMSRPLLSAIENGRRPVSQEELFRFAEVYKCEVSDLLGEPPALSHKSFPSLLETYFKKQQGPGVEDAARRFEQHCLDYLALEQITGAASLCFEPPSYPVAGQRPERAAEAVASAERLRLGFQDAPLIAWRSILEMDIHWRVFCLSNLGPESIFVHTRQLGGCLALDRQLTEERQRWLMAFHYGHSLIEPHHPVVWLDEAVPSDEQTRTWRFACAFADAFLLPIGGLVRNFTLLGEGESALRVEVAVLSRYYGVSVNVLVRRLTALRLLPSLPCFRRNNIGDVPLPARQSSDSTRLDLFPPRYRVLAWQAGVEDLGSPEHVRARCSVKPPASRTNLKGMPLRLDYSSKEHLGGKQS